MQRNRSFNHFLKISSSCWNTHSKTYRERDKLIILFASLTTKSWKTLNQMQLFSLRLAP